MAKHVQLVLDSIKLGTGSRKVSYAYKPNKTFDRRIPPEEREKTKTMFQIAQEELGETFFDVNACTKEMFEVVANEIGAITFDIDKSTAEMLQAVHDSEIRFGSNKFLQTVF